MGFTSFLAALSLGFEILLDTRSYFIKHLSANKNILVLNSICILSSYSLTNVWTDCMHYFSSFPILPFGTG